MAPSSKATAKPAKKAQKAAAAPSAKSSAKSAGRSAERISDSDLESDSEAESADEKASSGTSSSGEEESGESSSGTSSSGSESESDSDAADLPAIVPVPKPSSKRTAPPPKPTTSAPPAPFAPPKGFNPLPTTAAAPRATTVFSAAHLAGKQIWHITAPASLPLHTLTSVSLPAVLAGQPVVSHRGADYGFIRDDAPSGAAADSHTHILVPAAAARQRGWPAYAACGRAVDQTLHLQQLVELPGLVAGAQERATVPVAVRAARAQPKGLRMRFRPIGFGAGEAGEIGEEEESEAEAEPVFKKHKAVAKEEGGKKKKAKGEKGERSEKSEKKRKEKRAAAA